MTDGAADISTNYGKFFQYRASFATNDTDVSSYLLNHSITRVSGEVETPDTNMTIWNGTAYIDSEDETFEFDDPRHQGVGCFPDTTCEPENQDAGSSQCIYKVCNNGMANGTGVDIRINETLTNIDVKCDDDYTIADALTLNTSYQTIYASTLAVDACIDICVWGVYGHRPVAGNFEIYTNVTA
jgi:hypothetical protein